MAELPNVAPGEIIAASYTNDVRDRTLQRYADAAARDAGNPVPASGDMAFVDHPADSELAVQVHDRGSWQDLAYSQSVTFVGSPQPPWVGSITYTRFGKLVAVLMNITRSIVTLNGEWTIARGIPAEWWPSIGTVYAQVAASSSSSPGTQVVPILQIRHSPGSGDLIAMSRIENTVALRGSWSYFGAGGP